MSLNKNYSKRGNGHSNVLSKQHAMDVNDVGMYSNMYMSARDPRRFSEERVAFINKGDLMDVQLNGMLAYKDGECIPPGEAEKSHDKYIKDTSQTGVRSLDKSKFKKTGKMYSRPCKVDKSKYSNTQTYICNPYISKLFKHFATKDKEALLKRIYPIIQRHYKQRYGLNINCIQCHNDTGNLHFDVVLEKTVRHDFGGKTGVKQLYKGDSTIQENVGIGVCNLLRRKRVDHVLHWADKCTIDEGVGRVKDPQDAPFFDKLDDDIDLVFASGIQKESLKKAKQLYKTHLIQDDKAVFGSLDELVQLEQTKRLRKEDIDKLSVAKDSLFVGIEELQTSYDSLTEKLQDLSLTEGTQVDLVKFLSKNKPVLSALKGNIILMKKLNFNLAVSDNIIVKDFVKKSKLHVETVEKQAGTPPV